MRRSWILSAVGVLLALVAAYLVVGLDTPPPAQDEPVGLESVSPETTAAPLEAPPSLPPLAPSAATERVGEEERGVPRAAVSSAATKLHEEVFVHGSVTGPAGGALEKARLWVTLSDDAKPLVEETDERGDYRVGPLAPGQWRVQVVSSGLYPQHVDLLLSGEEPHVRHDFSLLPVQHIAVELVTSRGEATALVAADAGVSRHRLGLVPVATRDDPGDTYPVSSNRAPEYGIGRFAEQVGGGDSSRGPTHFGVLTFTEPGPGWISLVAGQQVLRKQQVDRLVEEVTFVVDLEDLLAVVCEVTATLVAAETGQPLAGEAWLAEEPFPDHPPVEAGPDGFVVFERVSPASRWLVAKAPERAEVRLPVDLAPGQRLEFGDVPLPPPVQLRGRVTRSTGEPARVQLHWGRLDPETGKVEWEHRYHVRSRADGLFSIPNLAPGIYAITSPRLPDQKFAPPEGWVAPPQRVDATKGTVEGIEVVVHLTTLITLAFPENVQDALSIDVLDEAGLTVVHTLVDRQRMREVRLVPGTYEVVLSRIDEVVSRAPLYVGSDPERVEMRF